MVVNTLKQGVGIKLDAGSVTASAAATVVTFNENYRETPIVVPVLATSGASTAHPIVTAANAGSCTIQTTSGLSYNWQSIGQ